MWSVRERPFGTGGGSGLSTRERPREVSRGIPRGVEAAIAAVALALSAPLILVAGLAIAITSPGPVFFRQERVGRGGVLFRMVKLRTMRVSPGGPLLTSGGDSRVTPVGRFLRRAKLDELPQFWNVLRGEMSLVGPRPEVPRYVDPENSDWKEILAVRPGITDPVTVSLRDEEALLARASGDVEEFYSRVLQPAKLREYARYLRERTWRSDLRVLQRTAVAILLPRPGGPAVLQDGEIGSPPNDSH